ncbi:alpha/beta fold hydrolase [Georgenia alba]|uniref:Alpha/beta fold hydrolase n=1 Tax=Georgenia alba TaxID=2233858 RepID=A0ABW2Q6D3_9MICO
MTASQTRTRKSTTVRSTDVRLTATRAAFAVLERTAPGPASRWAFDLWCTLPGNSGRRRDERPAGGTVSTTDVDGVGVSVETWGEGPAIYLVHGWGGWRGQLGRFVEPFVAAGRKVVAFDAPSHGTSEPGSLGKGRGNGLELARSLAVVSAQHGHPTAVVAHSFGCATTALAIRDGLAVDRLVAVAPSVDPLLYVDAVCGTFGVGPRTREAMLGRVSRFARRPLSDFDPSALTGELPAALVVHDRQDKEVPYTEGERLAAAWPGAELVTTEGLGHQRILRDEGVIHRVVDFATR